MKYIVLLRGINVSGKNKLPMADLRTMLTDLGFREVQTYIQSGNIILSSDETPEKVSEIIKNGIKKTFDYDVPVIVRTVASWQQTIDENPYADREDGKKNYFTFLEKIPDINTVEINKVEGDEFTIVKDVVYLYCEGGYGKTKLSNNVLEKKLKVVATTRNLKTTLKMLELATQ